MRRPLLILPALLLVLAACGGGGSDTPDGSAATETVTATPTESASPTGSASASPSVTAAPAQVRADAGQAGAAFATPTGNITCFIESERADGADGPAAGCTIGQKAWTAPRSDCSLAYGNIVRLQGDAKAVFDCRGDVPSCYSALVERPDLCGQGADGQWWHEAADGTVALTGGDLGDGRAVVLPYDTAIRVGAITCTSARTGVSCVDDDSGHGFRLSRAAYALTP